MLSRIGIILIYIIVFYFVVLLEHTLENRRTNLGYNAMEAHDRNNILIVVPISSLYMDRIGIVLRTWGSDLPANIKLTFFASKTVSHMMNQAFPDQSIMYADVNDIEYPPVIRNSQMLQSAYNMHSFDWLLKVDDDTYVNVEQLQTLVYSFKDSTTAFLGSRGVGRAEDREFLDLHKPMCMGGPGYLIRRKTLSEVVPYLNSCVEGIKNSKHVKYIWHSDVVISKCIYKFTSLGCYESDAPDVSTLIPFSGNIFKQHYPGGDPIYNSVTYHPLKQSVDMLDHHGIVTGWYL